MNVHFSVLIQNMWVLPKIGPNVRLLTIHVRHKIKFQRKLERHAGFGTRFVEALNEILNVKQSDYYMLQLT
jgi:hypothetical protein